MENQDFYDSASADELAQAYIQTETEHKSKSDWLIFALIFVSLAI